MQTTALIGEPGRLQQIAADATRLAIKAGADQAQATASEDAGMDVSVRAGKLEEADFGREQELSLTAFCKGGTGAASVGALSPAALQEAASRAVAIAKASAADPFSGLAQPDEMAGEIENLDLFHPWEMETEEAIALARRGEEAAAQLPHINRQKSDGASVSTHVSVAAYANSHGFCAGVKSATHSIGAGALAQKDGEMQQDGWSETARNPAQLPTPEEIGKKAGERAAQLLGGGKVKNCRAPVLFLPPASHSLMYHLAAAASGGALYRNMSWLLQKWQKPVLPAGFALLERPRLPGLLRSACFDSDGVATQTREVVADGVWRGRFLSAYSARRLKTKSTGNAGGAHNLQLQVAKTTPAAQLQKTMGRGLVVVALMGQGANTVTGDYSRGAAGFWVEGGEIAHPATEVTIAGNLADMLKNIAAVGDDDMRRGGMCCGSLLLPNMTIGGNQ